MITKAQRQYLKGLANPLKPIVMIGKLGLNDNILQAVEENLDARELIKIDVLKSCDLSAAELSIELAGATRSEVICQLGRKIVLYRYSKEHNNIKLPR